MEMFTAVNGLLALSEVVPEILFCAHTNAENPNNKVA